MNSWTKRYVGEGRAGFRAQELLSRWDWSASPSLSGCVQLRKHEIGPGGKGMPARGAVTAPTHLLILLSECSLRAPVPVHSPLRRWTACVDEALTTPHAPPARGLQDHEHAPPMVASVYLIVVGWLRTLEMLSYFLIKRSWGLVKVIIR